MKLSHIHLSSGQQALLEVIGEDNFFGFAVFLHTQQTANGLQVAFAPMFPFRDDGMGEIDLNACVAYSGVDDLKMINTFEQFKQQFKASKSGLVLPS